MKRCGDCNALKSLVEYHVNKANKDGRGTYCRSCHRLRTRRWKEKNRLEHLATRKKKRTNPVSKEMAQHYTLMARYGITREQYNVMLNKQDGKCRICKKIDTSKKLTVDHCHNSGKVRGLLCSKCNMGLGAFKDDKNSLIRAIKYLNTYGS